MNTAKLLPLILAFVGFAWSAEKVEILRDEYGVPHIFAATAAGAAFGSGYVQAEDRLEELLKNYRRAEGTMAEAFGAEFLEADYRQRLWRHRDVAVRSYKDLDPKLRAICEAFQSGIRQFMREHPERVPAWAPKLEPWQVVMLGRYIIWGWPEGEIASDLRRAGLQPDPPAYRGSNQMLIAPSRTAMRAPIAIIDPHLSWYNEFRWYELRLYGGELEVSGAAILGLPFPNLGHNRYVSVAMTTGGPDTSDVYEEEIKEGRYRFRNEWRPLEVQDERVGVKTGARVEWRSLRIEASHHGPIVARAGGKAYAAAIPYASQYRLLESSWGISTARTLADAKRALAGLQFMAQNVMIGTVDGDIFYVRNGRVPVRPKGCDPSRPMPGATGECEWQGIHPFDDLVQITNPPQGYMQNCNISPFAMMKDSPLVPEKWAERPYLYNAERTPPHQRAAMVLNLLDTARNVTAEQAIAIAFSTEAWSAGTWQERIRKAAPASPFAAMLAGWNRRSDPDSRPALGFYLFKTTLGGAAGRSVEPPAALTDDAIRTALAAAEKRLTTEFPPSATFGSLFRVGRRGGSRTWPVGGGSPPDAGMATPRAISFVKTGREMVGISGQTATQIVILTKPPQSFMVIPLGESDDPRSIHFDDQAAKLFSQGRAKPTYFLNRRELEKHVTAKKVLTF